MPKGIILTNDDVHGLLLDLLAVRIERLQETLDDSLDDAMYARIMGESWLVQNTLDNLKQTGPLPLDEVIRNAEALALQGEPSFREAEYPDDVLQNALQGVANGLLYIVDVTNGINVFIVHYFDSLKEEN